MKKSILPIAKLKKLSWRYDGPGAQEQIATIKCVSLAGANMSRAPADLRL